MESSADGTSTMAPIDGAGHSHPSSRKLAARPVDRLPRRLELVDLPDHGEHDAQIVQPDVRPQHRPKLRQEDVGPIQGEADAAPSQKRILFRDGEIGQRLVAPDVERAHGHRLGCERLEHLAIDLVLLVLHRKGLARHERKLGAIEPDLVDAEVRGDVDVGQQSDVQPQSDVNIDRSSSPRDRASPASFAESCPSCWTNRRYSWITAGKGSMKTRPR